MPGRIRRALFALLVLCIGFTGIVPSPVFAQAKTSVGKKGDKPQAPAPANIDRNGILILIRGTILALDQANKTGNYTVLRDLGAPGFQTNTAAQLAEIFADQRAQKLDLAGVAVLEPQLTLLPQIEVNGMLHMTGFFPSVPTQVNFELLFAPVDRKWRLFGLSVTLNTSTPDAPPTAAIIEATPPAELPDPPMPDITVAVPQPRPNP